ncbi:MAG: hypothetical protein A2508_01865 [Candidatus Lambdaproteobacteria bacterium RIFOXYD12_FULL_49_8]|nr:MAG: hypothetical protein A2508_01865 [Candidatus Lambdaproteobacteria bacterium RIFOXYD12_FULL_49_8]
MRGIGVFLLFCIWFAPELRAVTLQETLQNGMASEEAQSEFSRSHQAIDYRAEEVDELTVKSKLTSKFVRSRNDLADTQDVAVTASDKFTRQVAYTQTFDMGLEWSLTHYDRDENPLNSGSSKSFYGKDIFDISMAIWGSRLDKERLTSQKREIELEGEQAKTSGVERQYQVELAKAYLDYYLAQQEAQRKAKLANLTFQKLQFMESMARRDAPMEYQNLQMEALQARHEEAQAQVRAEHFKQLLELAQGWPVKDEALLEEARPRMLKAEELAKLYQNGDQVKVLARKIRTAERDLGIERAGYQPEVIIGGFTGRTNNGSQDGFSKGTYVEINYRFGGGGWEKASRLALELEELNLDLVDLKNQQVHQAAADSAELKMAAEMVVIKTKQLEIARGITKQSLQSFGVGQQGHLELVGYQEKEINTEAGLDKAKVDLWKKLADIAQKAEVDLLELAGWPSSSNQPENFPAQP